MTVWHAGALEAGPLADAPDLAGPSVVAALAAAGLDREVGVVAIDPALSGTAANQEAYGVPPEALANCVVVGGRRDGQERVAACVVLASTRADVNGVVKRVLDVRKASFLPHEDAVERTGMEHGGITPFGLPDGWRVLVDAAVVAQSVLVMGSGVRASKLLLAGSVLARVPGVEVVEHLGRRA